MNLSPTFARYVIATIVILLIVGLGVWYFFLRSNIVRTQINDQARGDNTLAPSFEGRSGSTYSNTVTAVDGTSAQPSTDTSTSTVAASEAPQLWNVSRAPVAGYGFVKKGFSTQLYFVERAGGNVLAADPATTQVTRLTNTLKPKIYEATVTSDASILLRSADDKGRVTTFVGAIATTSAADTAATSSPLSLYGTTLQTGLLDVAVNPTSKELFYIVQDPKAGMVGITSQWDGTKQKRLFTSPLSGWRTMWLPDGRLILLESPSDDLPGYAYQLNKDGTLTPLVSNIPGLTVLPRTGSPALLYGSSAHGSLALFAQIDQKSDPVSVPVRTIADKCLWAPSTELIAYCAVPQQVSATRFLLSWYAGALHTSDIWYRIDVRADSAEVLFTPDPNSPSLDVVDPQIDSSGQYLVFKNNLDQSLWMIHITAHQ